VRLTTEASKGLQENFKLPSADKFHAEIATKIPLAFDVLQLV
jgi:hypothetical protein